ncbi:MAG: hypothetical protein VW258_09735 [Thalassolituus sp.]
MQYRAMALLLATTVITACSDSGSSDASNITPPTPGIEPPQEQPIQAPEPDPDVTTVTTIVDEGGVLFIQEQNDSCTDSCTEILFSGDSVTVTALPEPGYTFVGWAGACNGSSPTCTVAASQLNAGSQIRAVFAEDNITIAIE